MNPGVMYFPAPSTTRAPFGTWVDARGPNAPMRLPRTTIVALDTGVPPLPSMIVAPTIATSVSGEAAFGRALCAPSIAPLSWSRSSDDATSRARGRVWVQRVTGREAKVCVQRVLPREREQYNP